MIAALLVLQIVVLIALIVLLLRKPATAQETAGVEVIDPRLVQLLAADLPTQFTRLDARSGALDQHLRSELTQLRTDNDGTARELRKEVLGNINSLGETLRSGLVDFRNDNNDAANRLRLAVDGQLAAVTQRITAFTAESHRLAVEGREALDNRLTQLGSSQSEHQERLREAVEKRLELLNQNNEKKLEEMRATVDEKLQSTLNTRLTESFGMVATHLGEVQKGLGEMKELATGVGDLKKVLTNVKARGIVGEFLLGQQLEQMFSPEQYVKNARIKSDTTESVEYALKFPNGPDSTVLLAIDSKFPREVGERLMHAYETGTAEEIATAGRDFERAIRTEGEKICKKYIDPPTTLPHAVMFLPTEGLYAEVVRRPGLQSELQQQCHVTIAGPSTFMAILTSFQMGFHTLAIERKGNQVWKVLAEAKKEFETFGGLMDSIEKQVGTVQNTIQKLGTRSRGISRKLKDVSSVDTGSNAGDLMEGENVLLLLAASEEGAED